jgi:hypothetical protein
MRTIAIFALVFTITFDGIAAPGSAKSDDPPLTLVLRLDRESWNLSSPQSFDALLENRHSEPLVVYDDVSTAIYLTAVAADGHELHPDTRFQIVVEPSPPPPPEDFVSLGAGHHLSAPEVPDLALGSPNINCAQPRSKSWLRSEPMRLANNGVNLTVWPVTRLAARTVTRNSKGGAQGARPSQPAGYAGR